MIRIPYVLTLMLAVGCAYTAPIGRNDPQAKPFKKSRLDEVTDSKDLESERNRQGWHWQAPSGLDLCPGSSTPYPGSSKRACK